MSEAMTRKGLSEKGLRGLLLLVVMAAILAAAALAPHLWHDQLAATLAERQNELRLIEARVNKAAQGRTTHLTTADDIGRMFLSGATAGLAQAGFQRMVDQTAQQHGMVIERLQPLPTASEGSLTTYRMEVVARGNVESVSAFLLALEALLPVVFIVEAQIAPEESYRAAEPEFPSESLTLGMQIETYGWTEEAAP